MLNRLLRTGVIAMLLVVACASGPSSNDLQPATTTTTTEPPPEGVALVSITNGSFRPSILAIDLTTITIVRWVHEDDEEREYVIVGRNDEFESPPLNTGDTFDVDFSQLEPNIYRYFATLGLTRVPGTVDTRPEQ